MQSSAQLPGHSPCGLVFLPDREDPGCLVDPVRHQRERKKCHHLKPRQTDRPSACWHCKSGTDGAGGVTRATKIGCEPLKQSLWFKTHRKGSGMSISGQELHVFIHEESCTLQAVPCGGDKSLPPPLENGNFPLIQDLRPGRIIF